MSASTDPSRPVAPDPRGPQSPGDTTGRLPEGATRRAWVVIVTATLFAETAGLQYTMVSPAAIRIAPAFPGVGANIAWMTTIFALVGAVSAPLLGKSSDLWGKKRMLLVAGVLFLAGSLVCCLTHSWTAFLVGRALEAMALGNTTVTYGLFRDLLPRRLVPTAVGFLATGFGLSALAAPLLSGWLLDHWSWRSIFWTMAGYGVVTMAGVLLLVPETRLRSRQRLDVLGALLLSGGLALSLLYLSEGHSWGWTSPAALGCLLGGPALLALFVLVERRVPEPLVDLRLLLGGRMLTTLSAALFGGIVLGLISYAMPLFLQTPTAARFTAQVRAAAVTQQHVPAATASLLQVDFNSTLAFAGGLTLIGFALYGALWQGGFAMAAGPVSGWLSGRIGPRRLLIGAGAFSAAGAALFLTTTSHGVWFYALSGSVYGIGFGTLLATAPTLVMEAVPERQQGVSTGMMSVVLSAGTAIGTAVVTAVIFANPLIMRVRLGPQTVATVDLARTGTLTTWHGAQLIYAIGIASSLVALVIAIAMRHGRRPATGGRAGEDQAAAPEASLAG
ncbi:MFS transporter [Phaeacidiphilus oryzae]|uniref:MFS transporter n=1 Tax=Phaeacidiphilus oryzae TaxID=348818 RepID=UPI00069241D6|nr:MFS transporter [Phaeacidiphilus oryzae]